MHRLRNARLIVRLVLAWFVLSLGVAVASPVVNPQSMELVCSSAGIMKLIVKAEDGSVKEVSGHTMDCPLCVIAGAPPPVAQIIVEPMLPLSHAVQSIPSARIAALTAAPLPARGPPSLS